MGTRAYAPQAMAATSADPVRSDDDLMLDLARGQQDALGPLYSRYASLVFQIASQSLGRTAAEELVQEVFLTIWRGAGSFDPSQGAFRPWLLRLTHWKVLNELRRRRRRPNTLSDAEDEDPLDALADQDPGPEERAWQTEHVDIVKSALAALPPKQRQAVALAFLEDMTHEQVARTLEVPLGTAKTRIRSGLQSMRTHLAPLAATLMALALAIVGYALFKTQVELQRGQNAIILITTSDLVPLRLTPPLGSPAPAAAHAKYYGKPDNEVAVLSTELLPAAPAGETYEAWARHGDTWTTLGMLAPNASGTTQLIARDATLKTPPDAVEITLEPAGGASIPSGQVVLLWPSG